MAVTWFDQRLDSALIAQMHVSELARTPYSTVHASAERTIDSLSAQMVFFVGFAWSQKHTRNGAKQLPLPASRRKYDRESQGTRPQGRS
jgi:hypothetical protein